MNNYDEDKLISSSIGISTGILVICIVACLLRVSVVRRQPVEEILDQYWYK